MATVMTTFQHSSVLKPPNYTRVKRQQYRSCDQCRGSRRACDAAQLGVNPTTSVATHHTSSNRSMPGWHENVSLDLIPRVDLPVACSHCSKTGKQCTFEWLKRKAARLASDSSNFDRQHSWTFESENFRPAKAPIAVAKSTTTMEAQFQALHPDKLQEVNAAAGASQQSPDLSWIWNAVEPTESCFPIPDMSSDDWNQLSHAIQVTEGTSYTSTTRLAHASDSVGVAALNFSSSLPRENTPPMNALPTSSPKGFPAQSRTPKHNQVRTPQVQKHDDRYQTHSHVAEYIRQAAHKQRVTSSVPTMSEIQAQDQLNTSLTTSLITSALFQIYRDSIEAALACWLTERTCPYIFEVQPSSTNGTPQLGRESLRQGAFATFYARVCHLDQSSSKWLTRRLTPQEDVTASRVLRTAIMAFASQWSHLGSSRQSSSLGTSLGGEDYCREPMIPSELDMEAPPTTFDRSFQESLWHQARRELQDAWELDSVRVSFAQLIFSVTQRHVDVKRHRDRLRNTIPRLRSQPPPNLDYFQPLERTNSGESLGSADITSVYEAGVTLRDRLGESDTLDGYPIYLETALRQLLCWRRKLQRMDNKQYSTTNDPNIQSNATSVSPVDRKTFDMLFWLGVICDTLAAASANRPLVISDEDSAIITDNSVLPTSDISMAHSIISNTGMTPPSQLGRRKIHDLWGTYFLNKNWGQNARPRLQSPCAVKAAGTALCEANTIKVLLYRKIANLQALCVRNVAPAEVEQCIQESLLVYQHWTSTYGCLIIDCLNHHDDLPAGLQCWYVVQAGHWYLAALLLADVIDEIDEAHKSGLEERTLRKTTPLTLGLRKDNLDGIAELARINCNPDPQRTSRTSESPHYFEGMALLSEPWTALLIKCFNKALVLISEWLELAYDGGRIGSPVKHTVNIMEHVASGCLEGQYDICVQALKMLARKSDVAYLSAMTFSWEKHLSKI